MRRSLLRNICWIFGVLLLSGNIAEAGVFRDSTRSPAGDQIFVGDHGWIVIHRTDGTRDSLQVLNGEGTLYAASWPSNAVVYVVGKSAWGTGILLKSVDGGKSWREIAPALPLFPFPAYYTDVLFVDAYGGWVRATRGYLLRTTDGGISWQVRLQPDLPSLEQAVREVIGR